MNASPSDAAAPYEGRNSSAGLKKKRTGAQRRTDTWSFP